MSKTLAKTNRYESDWTSIYFNVADEQSVRIDKVNFKQMPNVDEVVEFENLEKYTIAGRKDKKGNLIQFGSFSNYKFINRHSVGKEIPEANEKTIETVVAKAPIF